MTIKVTLNCPLNTAKITDLEAFLAQNLSNVRNFTGCKKVDLYFNQDKTELLIDEQWEDESAHKRYIKFIEDNGVLQELANFFSAPPSIKYFSSLPL